MEIFVPAYIDEWNGRARFISQAEVFLKEYSDRITTEALNRHWEQLAPGRTWIADHDRIARDFFNDLKNEAGLLSFLQNKKGVKIKAELVADNGATHPVTSNRLKDYLNKQILRQLSLIVDSYAGGIVFIQEPASTGAKAGRPRSPTKQQMVVSAFSYHAAFAFNYLRDAGQNEKFYCIGLLATMHGFNKTSHEFDDSKGALYRENLISAVRKTRERAVENFTREKIRDILLNHSGIKHYMPGAALEQAMNFWTDSDT